MDRRSVAGSGFAPRRTLDALGQDVRFALRSFRVNRLFTAIAIGTLALGIAAATTVASIVDATLLRPLPFPEPDGVVYISRVDARRAPDSTALSRRRAPSRWAATGVARSVSDALRARPAFESVTEFAPWVSQPYTLPWADGARVVNGVNVSHEFFSVFRVRPARGRPFTADDSNVSQPAVCVVTSTGARRLFNGRRDIVGETLSFVEGHLTVVGVMDDEFWYPMAPDIVLGQGEAAPDLLLPWPWLNERERPGQGRAYAVAARLRAGTTLDEADREARAAALMHGEPNRDGSRAGARARWLQDELALDARTTLLALAGLVGCLLLVCSVTIANLLLSRSRTRTRELAIRSTLGAGRGRLLAQLVTENFLLAACGGLGGLHLTFAALNTFVGLLPQGLLLVRTVPIDGRTLAIAALITLGVALSSGLGPALAATRGDLSSALKAGGHALARTARWKAFGSLLIAAESAALLVLLAGGGLLVNTLVRLRTIDLGFVPDQLWTADLAVPRIR